MAEAILNQPHFKDEFKARKWLESLRWPDGAICPHCGSVSKDHYRLEGTAHRPGLWKCRDCREQFSVTVGTVFERSKIKLNVWLQAMHLMCASKKGVSSKQLERLLGVTYQTAWFMSHRLREAMNTGFTGPFGSQGRPVEVDETYWGNVGKQAKGARGWAHKMKVVSLVERNGEKRSFHVANVTAATVAPILKAQVSKRARLMTDEARVYKKAGKYVANSFFSLENFRAKLAFCDALMKQSHSDTNILSEWIELYKQASALANKRNKLAHHPDSVYPRSAPGRRYAIVKRNPEEPKRKSRIYLPPPGALCLRDINEIRLAFSALDVSFLNASWRWSGAKQEPYPKAQERPGCPQTIPQLRALIHAKLGRPRAPLRK